ncbi:AMP-binding protein [Pusillimonas sp. SM2304]|uniref:AMP-binding protein n=1 Tax=Pusillimonas sp. SM2304 TaxID=3073241 RepID=UPI002876024B|nr:AMP-binding protein [Pusillimonas sp. SM2304]MDS1139900.1 AMP-binding protein [Pusillimonas sp. SM2304]
MDWRNHTFADALLWGAETYGTRPAVCYGDTHLSFNDLAERVLAFARGLVEIGVQPHEKVALWMADRPEWLLARWAVPMIGAILVPVNTRFRSHDLAYVLKQSDTATLIMQDGARGTSYIDLLAGLEPAMPGHSAHAWSSAALPGLQRVVCLSDDALPAGMQDFHALEALGRSLLTDGRPDAALQARMAAVQPDDVAQILYTSGTTSFPKGAQVCHGPLLQNNFQTIGRMRLTPEDRYLSCVPLFSATGTSYTLSMHLAGARMVILDRFDAASYCATVEKEGITVSFFVDAIVEDLRQFADRGRYDLSSLRTGTGAPLSKSSFMFITQELGVPGLISVYGMSETSNAVARASCDDPLEKRMGTNGRPVDGVRIRIADVDTNETLPDGQVGEICIAGHVLMKGYYKQPDEDGKVFDADGWLHSGDLGELDADGYLIYRGRVKEMIKPGGFNVATQEIEQFMKTYPGVREAVVVGVPDRRLGEVGYAYIEPHPAAQLTTEALVAYCREHIASYKVPRHVEFITDWPMTSSQKIRKLELKARAGAKLDGIKP